MLILLAIANTLLDVRFLNIAVNGYTLTRLNNGVQNGAHVSITITATPSLLPLSNPRSSSQVSSASLLATYAAGGSTALLSVIAGLYLYIRWHKRRKLQFNHESWYFHYHAST